MSVAMWEGLMGMSVLIILVGVAACVLSIIALWKLFEKAGEPGWKAIIPFYGNYIQFKICWSTTPYWFWLGCVVLGGIMNACGVTWLDVICSIAAVVLEIILMVKLAKAFGKSGGFAVGLVFLSTIFECILAFGSSEYVGPNGIPVGGYADPYNMQPAPAPQPTYTASVDTAYVPQAAQQPIYGYTPPQSEPAPNNPPQAQPIDPAR